MDFFLCNSAVISQGNNQVDDSLKPPQPDANWKKAMSKPFQKVMKTEHNMV